MAFHEDLRNHRLKKGLILEEISEDTKINVRILQALEQGDYHILPVPYIRLFMKAYALAIDYPVEDILRGLENELKLTGEQGITTNISIESASPVDMTGATISDVQNILQVDKSSQSNFTRLIGGILVLVIVIIFGKTLLNQSPTDLANRKQPLLPEMNLSQSLDSLKISNSLLSAGKDSLTITSVDFLSIIVQSGSAQGDTIYQSPGQSHIFILNDSLRLKLYPSDAAVLSIKQDTLPGSPFSNSWLIISADSSGGQLRTYSTL
ncbi:MAG: helix-turn-helix domain-containing protein [Candidatus Marinimicrobia bacterium]|nr:helix-turn-helix domain-containing protein [Candidatus Neomarinimicrobiota bacterium]